MPLVRIPVEHLVTDLADLDEMESMVGKPAEVMLNNAVHPGSVKAVHVVASEHQEDGTILRKVIVEMLVHIIQPWEPPVP